MSLDTRGDASPVTSLVLAPSDHLADDLAARGCMNPLERAVDLRRSGRARFLDRDGMIVHVTLQKGPQ